MKRTLTAAATLLASSAGAVGFAGTAAAAEAPELPDQLPVDNGVAQTAYHAVGTVHSATTTVGEVVPMQEQSTAARSGDLPGGLSGDENGGPLGGLTGGGSPLGGLTGGGSPLGGLTGGGSPLGGLIG
ncbi:hypothetical protein [Haloactinomyces albus]|uniref:Membrane protein n=1 Tax=Haloactinomyces albus TaxID=1352928 RepID=A0AAE3ZB72_9ACTN|nr:hypothetical protein [Haloactinomyces albus]MDR7301701.1 putative membrane protein [Haloactinomyces albus]